MGTYHNPGTCQPLCAACTLRLRLLADAHDAGIRAMVERNTVPQWVARAIGTDPTGARLPASDRTAGR